MSHLRLAEVGFLVYILSVLYLVRWTFSRQGCRFHQIWGRSHFQGHRQIHNAMQSVWGLEFCWWATLGRRVSFLRWKLAWLRGDQLDVARSFSFKRLRLLGGGRFSSILSRVKFVEDKRAFYPFSIVINVFNIYYICFFLLVHQTLLTDA